MIQRYILVLSFTLQQYLKNIKVRLSFKFSLYNNFTKSRKEMVWEIKTYRVNRDIFHPVFF